MLLHLPRAITRFEKHHKWQLIFLGGRGPHDVMLTLIYLTLPTVIAMQSDAVTAGLIKSAVLGAAAFVFAPLAGAVADRFGALTGMRIAAVLSIFTACFWLIMPLSTMGLAAALTLFYLRGKLNSTDTYLLRTTAPRDGGLFFGLSENIGALANFCAILVLPFFVATGHEKWAAVCMLLMSVWYLILTLVLPRDALPKKTPQKFSFAALSPFATLWHGWHFIRQNHFYPLFRLVYVSYSECLKGVLWFIFPIHLALILKAGGTSSNLPLSIYELLPAFFAGLAGYTADHFGWRRIHLFGWLAILAGSVLLPMHSETVWLVGAGAVIATGNVLAMAAATHILEEQDHDHAEDGTYMAAENVVANGLGMLVPLLAGFAYNAYGFAATLMGLSVFLAGVAGLQIGVVFWHSRAVRSQR